MGIGLTVIFDRGAVGGAVDAGDDLDQRALAAAVLAGKAVHLARANVEAHILERLDATEGHVDVVEGQKRLFAASRDRKLLHERVP
ncbi:hypothetical protein FQZ97_1038190 [compost metagenome]